MSRFRISFPAPRYPHYFFILCRQAGRRYSQVVRPRSAKPLSPGSNPGGASKKTLHTPCRVFLSFSIYQTCRCGGIGRRKGLKIPRTRVRAGSSPASGTRIWGKIFGFYPYFFVWGKDFGLFTPIFALFSSFSGLLPLFLLISHKS